MTTERVCRCCGEDDGLDECECRCCGAVVAGRETDDA